MFRRHLTTIALTLAAIALAACASPTAPKQGCAVSAGSGVCMNR